MSLIAFTLSPTAMVSVDGLKEKSAMWMTWVTPLPPADGFTVGVGVGFGREVALGRGVAVRRAAVREAVGDGSGLAVIRAVGVGRTEGADVARGEAVAPALGLGLPASDVLAPGAA
jgi:hypothetical protein